jgi:cephalosporin-C deacetylase-like acetyl esterase
MRSAIILAALSLATPAFAAEPTAREMLRSFLMAELQKHFDARRAEVAKLKAPEALVARQKALRAKFLAALGGLPERTPLKARTVGTVKGDGFTVEKVVYESRPGHHVTASFYVPDGKGPFPGVLMPIGHSMNGKAADYVQRGCMLLAKNGIAALAYDPIGQGERRQLLDDAGKAAITGSTTEHTLVGVGALLVGTSTATYRIWDGIRSLDYLASRPEVDGKKLGCTGCSGGGTLTSYLMALDDRIVAAAPSCYITSLERLFATIGPQDAEQNITGQVAFGMEHADYLTMRAPRPTLICAATGDFFDIRGTWDSFREAKRLYTLLGHPERVEILESDTKHGYPRSHREGMARWMKRWLAGKDEAIIEGEMTMFKDEQLQCTRTGQVLDDLKGVSAFGLNVLRAKALAEARAKKPVEGKAFRKALWQRLGLAHEIPAAKSGEVRKAKTKAGEADAFDLVTERGVRVPTLGYGKGRITLYVHEGGKEADPEAIRALVKQDRKVYALDLRGWGETAPATPPAKLGYFGVDQREAFLALHLGRPLTGQRVHDLLAIVEWAGHDVEVVGVGQGALVALHAAALSDRIKAVRLEKPLVSWLSVVETPLGRSHLSQVVPGALALYDLPELAASLAPRPLEVLSPVDAAGDALKPEAAEKAFAPVKAAFEKAKGKFRLMAGRLGPAGGVASWSEATLSGDGCAGKAGGPAE